MDIVALLALATPVETEAPLLAADLGSTPYEVALLLRAPSPVPLLRTDDRPRALGLLSKLRARGHDVVACESAAVVRSASMNQVRSFTLEPDAIAIMSALGQPNRIEWASVVALVRAVHRTTAESTVQSTRRNFSMSRAVLSGGLLLTKQSAESTEQASEDREPVLYAFLREGAPLLFQQSRTRYEGLGQAMRTSQLENFATLVRAVRDRAPLAAYDERLLAPRPGHDRVKVGVNGAFQSSTSDTVDLLAHLVAMAISRVSPYRSGR